MFAGTAVSKDGPNQVWSFCFVSKPVEEGLLRQPQHSTSPPCSVLAFQRTIADVVEWGIHRQTPSFNQIERCILGASKGPPITID